MALFAAGAGRIGAYDECHFSVPGTGTFRPLEGAQPSEGVVGERSAVPEVQQSFVVSKECRGAVQRALEEAHPYEVVAHSWISLENERSDVGYGVIGQMAQPMPWDHFVAHVKGALGVKAIRHSPLVKATVQRIAPTIALSERQISNDLASTTPEFFIGPAILRRVIVVLQCLMLFDQQSYVFTPPHNCARSI